MIITRGCALNDGRRGPVMQTNARLHPIFGLGPDTAQRDRQRIHRQFDAFDACMLSHEPCPYKDLWEPLGRVFDAFGFDRCMWGTDWTRAVGVLTYEQGVETFRITDRLSDSEWPR